MLSIDISNFKCFAEPVNDVVYSLGPKTGVYLAGEAEQEEGWSTPPVFVIVFQVPPAPVQSVELLYSPKLQYPVSP